MNRNCTKLLLNEMELMVFPVKKFKFYFLTIFFHLLILFEPHKFILFIFQINYGRKLEDWRGWWAIIITIGHGNRAVAIITVGLRRHITEGQACSFPDTTGGLPWKPSSGSRLPPPPPGAAPASSSAGTLISLLLLLPHTEGPRVSFDKNQSCV